MESFLGAGGEASKRKMKSEEGDEKRAKKEEDQSMPKRPKNAYWLFLADNREKFEKQVPEGIKKGPGTAKIAGEAWKGLSDKERAPYEKQAAKLKDEYQKECAKYAGDENDDAVSAAGA